jgi:chromosomal replication initiator protein
MVTINQVQEIVSRETKVELTAIRANSRKENIVVARHLSMYFCRWYTEQSLLKIAAAHGKGTHGTVINACSSVDDQKKTNSKYRETYERILLQIKSIK